MNDQDKRERAKKDAETVARIAKATSEVEVILELRLEEMRKVIHNFMDSFRNQNEKSINQIKANNIEEFLEQKKCKEPFYKNANGKKKHWE